MALVLAVAVAGGCSGEDDEARSPVTTIERTTTSTLEATTTSRTPEQEVEAAYLRSWDVYARAVRTFDTSELEEIYARDALALTLDEVEDRKARGFPSRVSVEHDYRISFPVPGKALVVDNYRTTACSWTRGRTSRWSGIPTRLFITATRSSRWRGDGRSRS